MIAIHTHSKKILQNLQNAHSLPQSQAKSTPLLIKGHALPYQKAKNLSYFYTPRGKTGSEAQF